MAINLEKLESGSVKITVDTKPAYYLTNLTEVSVKVVSPTVIDINSKNYNIGLPYVSIGTINGSAKPANIADTAELLSNKVFNFGSVDNSQSILPVTVSRALAPTDVGDKVLACNGNNIILTLPANSTPFGIGSTITIINIHSTPVEIANSGIYPTIISNGDMKLISGKSSGRLTYLGTDTWFLEGELTSI